jgi:hypothetical protein
MRLMECYDVMRMGMEMIQRIPEVRTAGMSNEEGCVMIGKVLENGTRRMMIEHTAQGMRVGRRVFVHRLFCPYDTCHHHHAIC